MRMRGRLFYVKETSKRSKEARGQTTKTKKRLAIQRAIPAAAAAGAGAPAQTSLLFNFFLIFSFFFNENQCRKKKRDKNIWAVDSQVTTD